MAWSHETYDGLYALGPDGVLKTALFELFRAVNERQEALSLTKTQWYKGSGGQAADLSLSDLTGLFLGNEHRINLQRLYSAIRTLTPFFNVTSDALTMWTVESLETAIGASLTPPIIGQRVMDKSLLEVAQAALDRLTLITIQATLGVSETAGTAIRSGSYASGDPFPPDGELDTAQDAWDARDKYSAAYSSAAWSASVSHYYQAIVNLEYSASESTPPARTVDFSTFGRTMTPGSTWYTFSVANSFTNGFDYTFSGVSETLAGSTAATTVTHSGSLLSLTEEHELALSVADPGTIGIPGHSTPPPSFNTGASISLSQCRAVIDISSELTDQL